jgi:hypothetical protein
MSERRLNAFHIGSFFYSLNNHIGKTKCANDLKFCTKIFSALTLHQMVHLHVSGKIIYSPIMSKNLSGVPLNCYVIIIKLMFCHLLGRKYSLLTEA